MRKTTTAIALFLALCSSASAEIEEARDLMEAGQFEAAREALMARGFEEYTVVVVGDTNEDVGTADEWAERMRSNWGR